MFPHIPLQAITLDLADTHSVSLTVDRVLNNTIYIPDQRQQQQALPLQGEEPSSSSLEPHPLPSSSPSSLLHHRGSSLDGESSDQETSRTASTESHSHSTSLSTSRDSSETPEQSTQSSVRESESDIAHSDCSAMEEAALETLRRRRGQRTDTTEFEGSSMTSEMSDYRTDDLGSNSMTSATSGHYRTNEINVENRMGSGPSPHGVLEEEEEEGFRVQFNGRSGLETSVPYEQRRGMGRVGIRAEMDSRGLFSSLQQRKEDMLKRARQ